MSEFDMEMKRETVQEIFESERNQYGLMVRNHNKSFKVKMDTFDRWITKKNSMMNELEKTSVVI